MRSSVGRAWVVVLALAILGCGKGDETAPIVEPPGAGCAAGEWLRNDGVCAPAGLPPDMPCPPAEWLNDDGACIAAGVPPDGCGEGFVHDGDRGCEPILPEAPCAPGLMAVPGETTCRAVAPCAAGTWGDIPVEPDTEYVDASYAGMDSDGSALKPWTSVQTGIDAASAGAIVAVAQGSYLEDVRVSGKRVRLWGVCPALVEVVGTGAEVAAIVVLAGATGTEVRGLAIRGGAFGFLLTGSLDVLLERVWLHDTAGRGVNVQSDLGATRITLRGSLVEQSHEIGMYVAGSEATVEASVVRSTQPNAQGSGRGVNAQAFSATGPPSTLLVRTSLVEQNHDVGVFVGSSAATVEASVVRDTQPDAQGLFGHGVGAQAFSTTSPPSTLLVRTSLVEQSHTNGVYVAGAEATLEASVVRDTQPNARGRFGRGVTAQAYSTTGPPSALLLRASLVDQNHDTGVFVAGSDANLEASVVRDTQPDAQGLFGRGVTAEAYPMMGPPTTLLVRTSLVERSHDLGVFVAGAQATVEASIVRDIQPDVLELGGRGLHVQAGETGAPSVLFLRSSLVAQSYEAGVAILGSVATIEACLLQGTQPSPGWGGGEAVMVVSKEGAASASITGTRIHESALAAVAAWGAHADVKGSALSCQAFDLDAESYQGTAAELEDLGGNVCGCPEPISRCKAVSAGLEPPPALESVQD